MPLENLEDIKVISKFTIKIISHAAYAIIKLSELFKIIDLAFTAQIVNQIDCEIILN
jgi:hypothetical protein